MSKVDELEKLLELEKASKDFKTFIKVTKPDYEFGWFHDYLIARLQKMSTQQNQRILISMPPRCGKSEIVSRRLPSWYLGLNPSGRVITCSYSAQLATLFNRDVQRIMEWSMLEETQMIMKDGHLLV